MTTTSVTNPLSPYLQVLEQEISSDLRGVVSAEDLRAEIRKTLTVEVLKRAQSVMYELQSNLSYGDQDREAVQKQEATALRYAHYVIEIVNLRRAQRINPNFVLAAPEEVAD